MQGKSSSKYMLSVKSARLKRFSHEVFKNNVTCFKILLGYAVLAGEKSRLNRFEYHKIII